MLSWGKSPPDIHLRDPMDWGRVPPIPSGGHQMMSSPPVAPRTFWALGLGGAVSDASRKYPGSTWYFAQMAARTVQVGREAPESRWSARETSTSISNAKARHMSIARTG